MKYGAALFAFFAFASASAANQTRFGDWSIQVLDNDSVLAGTTNDSGRMFGKICYVSNQNCVWVMSVSDRCENGATYPGLVNADSGGWPVTMQCIGNAKEGQFLMFEEYDKMQTISANDPAIGIALPMQGGNFKVLRFSLNGSQEATQAAESIVVRAAKSNTSDLTL
jgi:hypothetical protein